MIINKLFTISSCYIINMFFHSATTLQPTRTIFYIISNINSHMKPLKTLQIYVIIFKNLWSAMECYGVGIRK